MTRPRRDQGTKGASPARASSLGPDRARTPRQRVPLLLWLPALLGFAFVILPLVGLLVRAPWQSLPDRLGDPKVRTALRLSLQCSFGALGISLVLGVPLAWLLARVEFPGKSLVRALVLLPLVLPPVVGGVALLLAFGRRGLLGPWLEDMGIRLTFSMTGAMLAGAFVALPFLVLSVEGAIAGLDRRYEETAATLGAGPLRVFATVTLPLITPGLAAGAALAWARALGEFGATITFAGNLPGETQTLPLAVYLMLQNDPDTAVAVSLLLLAVSVIVLVALRGRWLGPAKTSMRRGRRGARSGLGASGGSADAGGATDAGEPAGADWPSDSRGPANSGEPAGTGGPSDSDRPAGSGKTAGTDAPSDSRGPANSGKPRDSGPPGAPARTDAPTDPGPAS